MESNPKLWLKLKGTNNYLVAKEDGAVETGGVYKEKAGTFAVEASPILKTIDLIWVALKSIHGKYLVADESKTPPFSAHSSVIGRESLFPITRTASSNCDHGLAKKGSSTLEFERGMGTFEFLKYMPT